MVKNWLRYKQDKFYVHKICSPYISHWILNCFGSKFSATHRVMGTATCTGTYQFLLLPLRLVPAAIYRRHYILSILTMLYKGKSNLLICSYELNKIHQIHKWRICWFKLWVSVELYLEWLHLLIHYSHAVNCLSYLYSFSFYLFFIP